MPEFIIWEDKDGKRIASQELVLRHTPLATVEARDIVEADSIKHCARNPLASNDDDDLVRRLGQGHNPDGGRSAASEVRLRLKWLRCFIAHHSGRPALGHPEKLQLMEARAKIVEREDEIQKLHEENDGLRKTVQTLRASMIDADKKIETLESRPTVAVPATLKLKLDKIPKGCTVTVHRDGRVEVENPPDDENW